MPRHARIHTIFSGGGGPASDRVGPASDQGGSDKVLPFKNPRKPRVGSSCQNLGLFENFYSFIFTFFMIFYNLDNQ